MQIGVYAAFKSAAHNKVKALRGGLAEAGHELRWSEPGMFRTGQAPQYPAVLLDPDIPQAEAIKAEFHGVPVIEITGESTLPEVLEALTAAPKKGPGRPKKNTEAPAAGSGQNAPASPAQEV